MQRLVWVPRPPSVFSLSLFLGTYLFALSVMMLLDSQQWKHSSMCPTMREERWVVVPPPPSIEHGEDDVDYDLYHLVPSRLPHTLIPIRSYGPRRNTSDSDTRSRASLALEMNDFAEELDSPPPYSPPRSPTYAYTVTPEPDFVFADGPLSSDDDVSHILCTAGYSRCLRFGLLAEPHQLSRHFDRLFCRMKRYVSKLKMSLHL
ncbi:hypothetical protein BC835DRAFT_571461 [Cytidiella melzeri]|nr:hypothetical protein BC835DRAFT_571461 [Cytidiella melzeri]